MMTDHDLEQAIFLAIARNGPSKQPAAVLKAIRETHVVIERGRWERVRACAEASDYYGKTVDGRDAIAALQPGDLDEG
jgi:hypothetical protein